MGNPAEAGGRPATLGASRGDTAPEEGQCVVAEARAHFYDKYHLRWHAWFEAQSAAPRDVGRASCAPRRHARACNFRGLRRGFFARTEETAQVDQPRNHALPALFGSARYS